VTDETGEGRTEGFKDPSIMRARRKAEALGLDGNIGEILSAGSKEEAEERMHQLGAMGGPEQLVTYLIPKICQTDENVRAAAHATLDPVIEGWGLPENFVEWYLNYSEAAPTRFDFEYGESSPSPVKIDRPRQKIFRDAAREFSFKAAREYLLRE